MSSDSESTAIGCMSQRAAVQLSVPAPVPKGKPRRIQDLLNGTAASRWYEQVRELLHEFLHERTLVIGSATNEQQFGSGAYDHYASDASTRSASSGEMGSGRQARFLREQDRCDIIRRMAAGEKQVALAREFKVTRAAICHIKKNRVRILAKSLQREARRLKRTRYQTISKPRVTQLDSRDGRSALPVVYEVRSLPMTTLLTALRNKETRSCSYRHFADRAISLLLEEALACADTTPIQLTTPLGSLCEGVQATQTSCGVAMGESAFPMLEAFCTIHPNSPAGYVAFSVATQSQASDPFNRAKTKPSSIVRLPPDLERHAVFLLTPICATGWDVCEAVKTLLAHGVHEPSIFVVCIVMSEMAAAVICQRYPAIRIVTAAIDPDVNEGVISPGIGDFGSRYSIHASESSGSNDHLKLDGKLGTVL